MMGIFKDSRFIRNVAIPSGIWVALCIIYVSVSVGWGNLSDFLAYELAVLIMSLVLPITLFAVIFGTVRSLDAVNSITEQIGGQNSQADEQNKIINDLTASVRKMDDLSQSQANENRLALQNAIDKMEQGIGEMSKTSANDIVELKSLVSRSISEQGSAINGLKDQLLEMADNAGDSDNTIDLDQIHQKTALLGLVNVILNDMNVAVTRILVRMMEMEGRQKNEIKDFIQGLVNAYSVGDRGVFFSVLNHQLASTMERIVGLQTMVNESPDAQRDMSKIIRELGEISSLFQRVDDEDSAKTICDSVALESLHKLLDTYFNVDGSSKETSVY